MTINFRRETEEERRIRREQEANSNTLEINTNNQPADVEVTGVNLRSYQRVFFDAPDRIRIGVWGRRTGKTTVLNAIANTEAYNDRSVLYLVPNSAMLLHARNNLINYNNNIRLVVANDRSIRGQQPSTLIIDDYQYMKGEIIDALLPIIDNPNCRVAAISTNNGHDHLNHLRDHSFFSSIPTSHPEVGIDLTQAFEQMSSVIIQQEFLEY